MPKWDIGEHNSALQDEWDNKQAGAWNKSAGNQNITCQILATGSLLPVVVLNAYTGSCGRAICLHQQPRTSAAEPIAYAEPLDEEN